MLTDNRKVLGTDSHVDRQQRFQGLIAVLTGNRKVSGTDSHVDRQQKGFRD